MPRSKFLRTGFTPRKGDAFISQAENIIWECVRANRYADKNGEVVKYGLIVGRHPELENESIVRPFTSKDGSWRDGMTEMRRGDVKYMYVEKTGTWRQQPQATDTK